METQQPNILFLMADQLAAAALGCYGSGVDSTPTLDALAARGVRYDRCYATTPVCAPNRATFLTGRSPVHHGIVNNNFTLTTDQPTYAHVLQANGYRTGGFGKFHATPMHMPLPPDLGYLGFDESVLTDDTKWGWYEWVQREHPEHADMALAMCWARWPSHPQHALAAQAAAARDRHLKVPKSKSPWPMMYASPLPAEVHDSTFITDVGLDFMRRHLEQHPGQPFFCHMSYVDPHDPYDPPAPYAERYRADDMPPARPAAWEADDIQTLRDSQRFGGFEKVCNDPAVVGRLRALYHGSLRYLDDQLKRVMDFLRANGLEENTLVVFTTDHGEMLGDHGLITKGRKHYDMGIRCPLLIAGPGVAPATVNDRLTCTLDFFPTFCDWAGVPTASRPPLEGRSFASTRAGDDTTPSTWQEISVSFQDVASVITDDRWRLTRYFADNRGQMFDLNADPDEQHNLYNDPACAARRQELLERLLYVSERPRVTMRYRNMPFHDGLKIPVVNDRFLDGVRHYDLPPTPGV